MISAPINIQVCHHPESDHPIAQGREGRWMSFGNTTYFKGAIAFAKLLSTEQLNGRSLRVLVRDENLPKTVFDLYVNLELKYSAKPTFPERSALDYQSPTE